MNTLTIEEYQKKAKELRTPEEAQKLLQELLGHLTPPPPTPSVTEKPITPPKPLILKKYEEVEGDPKIEEVIISLYGKGLTTKDIENHFKEHEGIIINSREVSEVTNKVLPQMQEWQQRPLARQYPFMYLDGLHYHVRDSGKIAKKYGFSVLGITEEGKKDILGIWVGEIEGAKTWTPVLNEIKARGVEDILICCVDGLKGFPDAINAIFPQTTIQQCIVHQVRTTMKCVAHRDKQKFCADQRAIYTAINEEAGFKALQELKEKWPQYTTFIKSWEEHWGELSPFFAYGQGIRKIIYTTNMVENLQRQFRKVTKTTTIFPHEEALRKLLYLAARDISKKWNLPMNGWREIIQELAINFPERVIL